MKHVFFIFFLIVFESNYSQKTHDFNYNTSTEYQKHIKKYPKIQVVSLKKEPTVLEIKNVVYFESNKKKLYLDVFQNLSKRKKPAIIFLHGGGWKSGDKSMAAPLAQSISKKGFTCFSIEYSLSNEAKYPKSIEEVLIAIDFVKKEYIKYNIDTLKIGIVGCSSGGQMASLVGTKYSKKVQAVINLDGILAFHHPQSKEGILAAEWLGGTYEEKPLVWEDASPLNHVSKFTPPFLFINSQYDRFHAGRDDMIVKLNSYKIYSEIQTINDSPHSFWLFEPWFEEINTYIVQFLKKIKFN